jgi:hypothetical protein
MQARYRYPLLVSVDDCRAVDQCLGCHGVTYPLSATECQGHASLSEDKSMLGVHAAYGA